MFLRRISVRGFKEILQTERIIDELGRATKLVNFREKECNALPFRRFLSELGMAA
jgi:hypothetical protein